MDTSRPQLSSLPSSNPPSVEIAYKRKCIALKKRLAEVEAENELMRTRNRRGWQYIQKMRLESCLLLERLANVTGMAEQAQSGAPDAELRARAVALMSSSAAINGLGAAHAGQAYLDDETEGSSEEQPPTPDERPLRVKRSRKPNATLDSLDDDPAANESIPDSSAAALPRLAPAPTQEELTSTFRIQPGSNGSAHEPGDPTPAGPLHVQDRRGSHQPDTQLHAAAAPAEHGPMAMEMDVKEPKVEQG